jgi:hypothetical protein
MHQETLDNEHTTCIKCRSSMPCTCKFHHSDAVPLDPHYIYPIEILHSRSDFVVSREQLNYDEKSLKTHESDFTLENLIRSSMEPETLKDIKCEKCNTVSEFRIKTLYYNLPNILVF